MSIYSMYVYIHRPFIQERCLSGISKITFIPRYYYPGTAWIRKNEKKSFQKVNFNESPLGCNQLTTPSTYFVEARFFTIKSPKPGGIKKYPFFGRMAVGGASQFKSQGLSLVWFVACFSKSWNALTSARPRARSVFHDNQADIHRMRFVWENEYFE